MTSKIKNDLKAELKDFNANAGSVPMNWRTAPQPMMELAEDKEINKKVEKVLLPPSI